MARMCGCGGQCGDAPYCPAMTVASHPLLYPEPSSGSPLKFMPPGHFCPDVAGIEDFGEADHLRGRVVRAFFWAMGLWPHPRASRREADA